MIAGMSSSPHAESLLISSIAFMMSFSLNLMLLIEFSIRRSQSGISLSGEFGLLKTDEY